MKPYRQTNKLGPNKSKASPNKNKDNQSSSIPDSTTSIRTPAQITRRKTKISSTIKTSTPNRSVRITRSTFSIRLNSGSDKSVTNDKIDSRNERSSVEEIDYLPGTPPGSDQLADDDFDYLSGPPSYERSVSTGDSNGNALSWSNTTSKNRRKQVTPKKSRRRDRVQGEMIKLQASTKLLIARLPFQRMLRGAVDPGHP